MASTANWAPCHSKLANGLDATGIADWNVDVHVTDAGGAGDTGQGTGARRIWRRPRGGLRRRQAAAAAAAADHGQTQCGSPCRGEEQSTGTG